MLRTLTPEPLPDGEAKSQVNNLRYNAGERTDLHSLKFTGVRSC